MYFKKELNLDSVVIAVVNPVDHPDYVEAYIEYAEWKDGSPLTVDERDWIAETNPDLIEELAMLEAVTCD